MASASTRSRSESEKRRIAELRPIISDLQRDLRRQEVRATVDVVQEDRDRKAAAIRSKLEPLTHELSVLLARTEEENDEQPDTSRKEKRRHEAKRSKKKSHQARPHSGPGYPAVNPT